MEVDKLNRWLSLAANIGVIAGIIFLGIEIRQNTSVTRSAASQEISGAQVDFFMRVAESPDLARVVKVATESPGELSELEVLRYQYVTGAVFMLMEGAYKQYRLGFLPAAGWEPYERLITSFLNNPISRSWWVNSSAVFSPEFEAKVIAVSGVERKTN
jgi:hypothetical protein